MCLTGMEFVAKSLLNVFDSFVVIISIASILLCTRSVFRALKLGQVCSVTCTIIILKQRLTVSWVAPTELVVSQSTFVNHAL